MPGRILSLPGCVQNEGGSGVSQVRCSAMEIAQCVTSHEACRVLLYLIGASGPTGESRVSTLDVSDALGVSVATAARALGILQAAGAFQEVGIDASTVTRRLLLDWVSFPRPVAAPVLVPSPVSHPVASPPAMVEQQFDLFGKPVQPVANEEPAMSTEKLKREKKSYTLTPEELALIKEFRAAYLAHVDPRYRGFDGGIPTSEKDAARWLLAHWDRKRLSDLIAWTVRDKCEPQGSRKWTGWSGVVKCLAKFKERLPELDQKCRIPREVRKQMDLGPSLEEAESWGDDDGGN